MRRFPRRSLCAALVALSACAAAPADRPPPPRAAEPRSEPELFEPGVVSTGGFESHLALTPEGRTLWFVRSSPQFTDWTIYVSELAGGRWSAPEVASFSGTHRDADPFVTADGRQLYFISDRPVDGERETDMDVWVIDKTETGGWGEPRNLGAPINTPGNEWFPTLSADGTLYFGSDRPGGQGRTDLYRARREGGRFAEPENLGPNVNSAAEEFEGCIAPDESFLVLMAAGRPDSRGGGDLYISYGEDAGWTPAKNLGPEVNGPGLEISPYFSPDGRSFFFSSARRSGDFPSGARPDRPANGPGDFYRMDLGALHDLVR